MGIGARPPLGSVYSRAEALSLYPSADQSTATFIPPSLGEPHSVFVEPEFHPAQVPGDEVEDKGDEKAVKKAQYDVDQGH